ncbi:MAG: hypothetical protein LQ343_003733 [Gyalolechia ehrenbergii]|nr:MAG: hypothetical protein LQ343_003733 [Gyalolechia ehrenbergii]
MPVSKGWLPREAWPSTGFTADLLLRLFKNTALNPCFTLPTLLLGHYTRQGQTIAAGHEVALKRLKQFVYLGILRWMNNVISGATVNNWNSSKYDWKKEIVVITGGSDGIGKLVALLLQETGARVAVLDVQPLTFEPPPNVSFFKCDIASPEEVSACAALVRSEVGVPTILINNAGTGAGLPLLNTTEDSVSKVFQVNILSHFRLIREFVPAMVAADHGTIVTIASIAAGTPAPSIVPYSCTKSAAVALHEGLAAELKLRYNAPKVRTICVCPGWVRTRLTDGIKNSSTFLFPWQQPETVAEKIHEKIVSGSSGMVFVPDTAWHFGWILRSLPMWWQTIVRNSGGEYVPSNIAIAAAAGGKKDEMA